MGAVLLVGQLALNSADHAPPPGAQATMVPTRSTQSLFEEPFAPRGGASARIDRIAMARSSDLRENRFARWGVR